MVKNVAANYWKPLKLPSRPYPKMCIRDRQRDYNDSHRAVAPLKPAEDAVIVDTTGNTFEQSVDVLTNLIKERLA